jgi:hypothetical protein
VAVRALIRLIYKHPGRNQGIPATQQMVAGVEFLNFLVAQVVPVYKIWSTNLISGLSKSKCYEVFSLYNCIQITSKTVV